jgi:hypothetical protein
VPTLVRGQQGLTTFLVTRETDLRGRRRQQTLVRAVVCDVAAGAVKVFEGFMRMSGTQKFTHIGLMTNQTGARIIGALGAFSQKRLFVGGMRIMAVPAAAFGNGKMHAALTVFILKVAVTVVAEVRGYILKDQLLGKAVAFVATLTVFILNRFVDCFS